MTESGADSEEDNSDPLTALASPTYAPLPFMVKVPADSSYVNVAGLLPS